MIRDETPADIDAIRQIHLTAFRGLVEARLVDELRADGDLRCSLVAGFATRYAGPHFMVRPLGDGSLPTLTGDVAYGPAFDRMDG